jgi:excinuclease Cho
MNRRRTTTREAVARSDSAADAAPVDLARLRAAAQALPAAPGVYIFHGDSERLPLYIGKSVNLRSRVLAHLRNPDEARLLRQTRHISHQRTAGEIGALLLESRLIKSRQPLLNQRLRRSRQLCAWHAGNDARLRLVDTREREFATTPGLYGLYGTRRAAVQHLAELADAHRLCLVTLGVEPAVGHRACLRAMIGRCAGACRGDETPQSHWQRTLAALEAMRVAIWPFEGAMGIVERFGTEQQIHVVHRWRHVQTVADASQADATTLIDPAFDVDAYRILCGPILTGQAELVSLPTPG